MSASSCRRAARLAYAMRETSAGKIPDCRSGNWLLVCQGACRAVVRRATQPALCILKAEKNIEQIGGLRIERGDYLADAMPLFRVSSSLSLAKLRVVYPSDSIKQPLLPVAEKPNLWALPLTLRADEAVLCRKRMIAWWRPAHCGRCGHCYQPMKNARMFIAAYC